MPATFSEIDWGFWAWIVEKQTKTSNKIPKRFISDLLNRGLHGSVTDSSTQERDLESKVRPQPPIASRAYRDRLRSTDATGPTRSRSPARQLRIARSGFESDAK